MDRRKWLIFALSALALLMLTLPGHSQSVRITFSNNAYLCDNWYDRHPANYYGYYPEPATVVHRTYYGDGYYEETVYHHDEAYYPVYDYPPVIVEPVLSVRLLWLFGRPFYHKPRIVKTYYGWNDPYYCPPVAVYKHRYPYWKPRRGYWYGKGVKVYRPKYDDYAYSHRNKVERRRDWHRRSRNEYKDRRKPDRVRAERDRTRHTPDIERRSVQRPVVADYQAPQERRRSLDREITRTKTRTGVHTRARTPEPQRVSYEQPRRQVKRPDQVTRRPAKTERSKNEQHVDRRQSRERQPVYSRRDHTRQDHREYKQSNKRSHQPAGVYSPKQERRNKTAIDKRSSRQSKKAKPAVKQQKNKKSKKQQKKKAIKKNKRERQSSGRDTKRSRG